MNILIITSSYPSHSEDPSGTAGLFVRQFSIELAAAGHTVIVQPVARKNEYKADPGITIVPAPWRGGDRELASMNFRNPGNWWTFLVFFIQGVRNTLRLNERYKIQKTFCMWALPSGILGLAGKIKGNIPYDVWALGSDIWRIRKIPFLGGMLLRLVMKNADKVFADGYKLCEDVKYLTRTPCRFLPSSRKMPAPIKTLSFSDSPGSKHFLYVGRYHPNKGPDLLVKAVGLLPRTIREAVRVHMFGIGPLKEELKDLISELRLQNYINLNGPIRAQDFSNYLNSVSYLVIPSRIESIPVVFSDSLQIGTPVVATPVGDMGNLIKEFGCGIVAKEVSPEALASAIQEAALTDDAGFRQKTAAAYELFDIKNAVAQWLSDSPASFLSPGKIS